MSYAQGTPNFNLPLTQGSDKRDWSDTNQAFSDLDAAVSNNTSDAALALSTAQTAQTSADGAVADAASAVSTANAAASQAATASELASLARTEAQSAVTTAQSAQSTAQSAQSTASNADTVALQAQSDIGTMSNLQTQDKTSLVAAINEVLSQIGGGMPVLDFSQKHDFANTSYTPSKNGILYVAALSNAGGDITIDGESIFSDSSSSGTGFVVSFEIPVKANSVIVSTIAASTGKATHCYFVPYTE